MLERMLFAKDRNIARRVYFWNLCAGLAVSFQSAVLLLVVKRAGGDFAGGVFVILYTVPQMLYALSAYSMREFQVSDVKGEYHFPQYYTSRLMTSFVMIAACLGYGLVRGFSGYRMAALLLLAAYRVIESIEDVYHGEFQKRGRLDAAALSVTLRVVLSTVVFCVVYVLSTDLVYASAGMTVSALVLFLLCNRAILGRFGDVRRGLATSRVGRLLSVCFPLFLGAILYNYLVNAPKYSIDRILGEEAQTVFNVLFLPVFIINAVCLPIAKPMVKQMGIWWHEKETVSFVKAALLQGLIIVGISIVIIAGGYLLGCPVLGWVYGADLSTYPVTLAVFLCFGGIAALAAYLAIVLTIMRKQWCIITGYAIGYIVSLFVTDRFVRAKGIPGAGYAYGVVMAAVFVAFVIMTVLGVLFAGKKQEERTEEEHGLPE